MVIKTLLILFSVLWFSWMAMAQETPEQQRKNIIKLEITHALYPNSFVMSYERVTKPNQSLCVTSGYEAFPPLIDVSSTTRVRQNLNRNGFRIGSEYRFYLKGENRHLAPHGTYIGPYVAYHDFYNKREIEVEVDGITEIAQLETDFGILNIGFQLGHQFIIKDRFTIDVITLGPAISNYYAKLKLKGDFTFDKDEVQSEILLKLLDRFPMLEELLTDKEISSQGRFDSWSYGWRFQLNVGYYFGRMNNQ
jgi:hypothetical protein